MSSLYITPVEVLLTSSFLCISRSGWDLGSCISGESSSPRSQVQVPRSQVQDPRSKIRDPSSRPYYAVTVTVLRLVSCLSFLFSTLTLHFGYTSHFTGITCISHIDTSVTGRVQIFKYFYLRPLSTNQRLAVTCLKATLSDRNEASC